MSAPDFSILIVNRNAEELLRQCLESLVATAGDVSFEIILVDNGSTDGSLATARGVFPEIVELRQPTNIGYVRANNVGLARATGKYLLYLNNDTKVLPECLPGLRAFLDAHSECGALSPQILNADGTDQGVARNFPTFMNGLFGRRSVLTRVFPRNPWTRRYMIGRHHRGDAAFECEMLSAACLAVPTALARDLGGFDEGFTHYWVDSEFVGRVRKRGRRAYCLPAAKIIHFEGSGGSTATFRQRCRMTIAFNRDAYLAYVKVLELAPYHPMRILAATALTMRAFFLMSLQLLRPSRATSSGGRN